MKQNNVNPTFSSFATIVKINLSFFTSFMSCLLAWVFWPNSLEDYGFGLLAIFLGAIAFRELIDALKNIAKLYNRDKVLTNYSKQGEAPKTSTLACTDSLKDAGMR